MADRGTRWAVVVIGRFLSEQHLERHRVVDYNARVITNTQGREMTENGRNYVFGNTIDETDFYETDTESEAIALAKRFNALSDKGLCQELKKLA